MAAPMVHRSSLARDWISAPAVTCAAAVGMPDFWTHVLGWGSNLQFCSDPRCCSQILNLLRHTENSYIFNAYSHFLIWTPGLFGDSGVSYTFLYSQFKCRIQPVNTWLLLPGWQLPSLSLSFLKSDNWRVRNGQKCTDFSALALAGIKSHLLKLIFDKARQNAS